MNIFNKVNLITYCNYTDYWIDDVKAEVNHNDKELQCKLDVIRTVLGRKNLYSFSGKYHTISGHDLFTQTKLESFDTFLNCTNYYNDLRLKLYTKRKGFILDVYSSAFMVSFITEGAFSKEELLYFFRDKCKLKRSMKKSEMLKLIKGLI